MSQRPKRTPSKPPRYRRELSQNSSSGVQVHNTVVEGEQPHAPADEGQVAIVADTSAEEAVERNDIGSQPETNEEVEEDVVAEADGNENLRMTWGDMKTRAEIQKSLEEAYLEIVKWRRNVFDLPKNAQGKDLITELTRLLQLFTLKTAWQGFSLLCVTIFVPLMLQKPSARSKHKDHTQFLAKRLLWWKNGNLKALLSEGNEIQKRLVSSRRREEGNVRGFTRLVLLGKVKQAVRLIDADNDITGVHESTDEVLTMLNTKHPNAEPLQEAALVEGEVTPAEEVIFQGIDQVLVQKAA